jgi:RNA methyltransferase, TrmH family
MEITKNQLKEIKSLQQSKFRQIYKNFVAEGHKVATELLRSQRFEIVTVLATQKWIEEFDYMVNKHSEYLYQVTNEQMAQVSSLKNPTDVLIVAKQKLIDLMTIIEKGGNYFFLDEVQDPGNVGTIIRIADWFGFSGVIASENTADFFQSKVVQATMGSIAGPHLIKTPTENLSSYKGNFSFYAMDMSGVPLERKTFNRNNIFIMGNEGHGISNQAKSLINSENYLTIPGFDSKIAESLNVSIAAGILANKVINF